MGEQKCLAIIQEWFVPAELQQAVLDFEKIMMLINVLKNDMPEDKLSLFEESHFCFLGFFSSKLKEKQPHTNNTVYWQP